MTLARMKYYAIFAFIVFGTAFALKATKPLLTEPDVLWAQVLRGLVMAGVILFAQRQLGLWTRKR